MALNVATALPAAADPPSRVALPSPNVNDTTGTVVALDPTMPLSLRVYLADRPGLAAAASAVSDPGDVHYAHFLSATQYDRWFAPTATQTAAVRAWLTAQGMTITSTTAHYFAVTATVAQTDAAFQTQVSEFDSTVTEFGFTFTVRQPGVSGGFSVPAALGGDILSVTGIDQIVLPDDTGSTSGQMMPAVRARAKARAAATAKAADAFPCSQYWGQYTRPIPTAYGHTTAPTQLCGYTPDQIRHAYGLSASPYTGRGRTIAVVLDGHSPTEQADANRFFAAHDEPAFTPGQYSETILPDTDTSCAAQDDPNGDPLEESIDVQSAHLAAPAANIAYVGVPCTSVDGGYVQAWLDGASRVVDQHLADVVTGSWGIQEKWLAPADMAPWNPVLEQGAVQGIGFDFSSGDGGDAVGTPTDPTGSDVHDAQFPASDPWATAVGGTSVDIGQDGSVVGDVVWGDNLAPIDSDGTGYGTAPPGAFQEGSGGGVSTTFAQPDYQKWVVPRSLATTGGTAPAARVLPDISADAGNPWLIGATGLLDPNDNTYEELPWGGGTSAASPLIAGMEADAMQAAGHPFGFANPRLYRLAHTGAIRDILPVDPADPPIALGAQDITEIDPTQLTTFGEDATLTVTPGFDDATGIGAPTPSFVADLGRH